MPVLTVLLGFWKDRSEFMDEGLWEWVGPSFGLMPLSLLSLFYCFRVWALLRPFEDGEDPTHP